jgi:hypothetical protein
MSTETDVIREAEGEFLTSNAGFFAQTFGPLNALFENSGPMQVVSEESEMTLVVGVRETEESGVMDVDCVMLEPNQESLRDCVNTILMDE